MFRTVAADGETRTFRAAAGEIVTSPVVADIDVSFCARGTRREYRLAANALYYFLREGGRLDLHQVTFGNVPQDLNAGSGEDKEHLEKVTSALADGIGDIFHKGVVPVMILVDEEEPIAESRWENRLRERVESASRIIQKCCGIQFQVVATGKWRSSDKIQDFLDALHEFESRVIPIPSALAIGFTSQFGLSASGKSQPDGIRGPLQRHILIPEGLPRVAEVDRLEMLVHELGHYLGAVHCPSSDSVMRLNVCDGRAHSRTFPIRFDPVNTLVVNVVAEEIRSRRINELCQLSPGAKRTLRPIYYAFAQETSGELDAPSCLDEAASPREGRAVW